MDIDVTDILADSYIAADPFLVIRRIETVNAYGEAGNKPPERIDAFGAVYPTGSNSLVREDAYSTGLNTIKVVTQFKLRGPSKEATNRGTDVPYKPDIILWKGSHYVVVSLNDYSQYGAGFVEAECMSTDYIDPPTQPPTGAQ